MSLKIGCVVVTYNRKYLLKECLDAICTQTYKPAEVYITDNASTDGTQDFVKQCGYYDCNKNGIRFKYILNTKNEGGAGGFYLGMKTAHENGSYDAFWVMDDDGIPDSNCLKVLVSHLNRFDYISPLVIAKEDHNLMAFPSCTVTEYKKLAVNGVIYDKACPFNGILYSNKLVSTIGFPKKELFIWGDEDNYNHRALEAGFQRVTIIDAIHIHPKNRQIVKTSFLGKEIKVTDSNWKLFCMMRNNAYNNRVRKIPWIKRIGIPVRIWFYYAYYYAIKEKSIYKIKILTEAMLRGFFSNFGGMEKYMNR